MKKNRTGKKKKSIVTMIAMLSLVLTICGLVLAIFFNPSKRDVRNITLFLESYVKSRSDSLEILSDGIPANLEARIAEIEKDVTNVESSKLFSLGSDTYLKLSEFYFDYSDLKKSREYGEKALKKDPLNFRARIMLSVVNFYQGNLSAAIEASEKVAKHLKAGQPVEEKTAILAGFIQSMSSLLLGNPKQSINYLENLESVSAKSKDYGAINFFCFYYLSKNYLDIDEFGKAEQYYEHYVQLKKGILKKNVIDKLSRILLALTALDEDPSNAILSLNEFLSTEAKGIWQVLLKTFFLALMEIKNNNIDQAYEYLIKSIELSSSSGNGLMESLSRHMMFMAKYETNKRIDLDILRSLEEANVHIPILDVELYKALAKYFIEQKDYTKAKQYLATCFKVYNKAGMMDEVVRIHVDTYLLESNFKNYFNAYENISSALDCVNEIFQRNSSFRLTPATWGEIRQKILEIVKIEKLLKEAKDNLEKVFGFGAVH
jgi:hypothetical protein